MNTRFKAGDRIQVILPGRLHGDLGVVTDVVDPTDLILIQLDKSNLAYNCKANEIQPYHNGLEQMLDLLD